MSRDKGSMTHRRARMPTLMVLCTFVMTVENAVLMASMYQLRVVFVRTRNIPILLYNPIILPTIHNASILLSIFFPFPVYDYKFLFVPIIFLCKLAAFLKIKKFLGKLILFFLPVFLVDVKEINLLEPKILQRDGSWPSPHAVTE